MKLVKKGNGLFDIEVSGEVVGGGSVIDEGEGMVYLERLDIDEGHRNKGYGTKVIGLVQDTYGGFYLAPDNKSSQRLFDREMWEMDAREYDKYGFAIDQGFGVYVLD